MSAGSRARNGCGMSNEVVLEKFVRMGSGRTGTRPSWRPCRAAVASPTSTLIRLLDFADSLPSCIPAKRDWAAGVRYYTCCRAIRFGAGGPAYDKA